jgi:hypothetical protein
MRRLHGMGFGKFPFTDSLRSSGSLARSFGHLIVLRPRAFTFMQGMLAIPRPMPHRLSSFRSCVQLYRWLIRRGFRETFNRFDRAFALSNPSEIQLLNAIDTLEKERRIFLERLAVFERRRVRQKARKRRVPIPSETTALYAPDYFVVPNAGPQPK